MIPVMKAISFLLLAHQAVALHDEYKVSVVVGCKEEEEGYVTKNESGLKFFFALNGRYETHSIKILLPLDRQTPTPTPPRRNKSISHRN
jgi:hypothetical protein